MLELTLRLIFSLAVVIGLLLLLTKLGAKRFRGGPDALVQVVQRQALSRTTSVSVVTVGSRVLVLGTTEHQVSVLAELDPEELVSDLQAPEETAGDEAELPTSYDGTSTPVGLAASTAAPAGPLSGSVFSPDTWRRTMAALSQNAGARGAGPRS